MAYEQTISDLIFNWLHPHFMAMITLLLSALYMFKYICIHDKDALRQRQIYILRSFLWLLFAISWVIFPYVDIITERSMMLAMIATIVLTEIAYNILFLEDAIREMWRWILRK